MAVRYETQGLVVEDHGTGLMWEAEAHPDLTWAQAGEVPYRLNAECFGGYDDWRLPPAGELLSLVDYTRIDPASDFPGMPSEVFWSSSEYSGSASLAWCIYFYDGLVDYFDKMLARSVRCVRGQRSAQGQVQ